MPMAPACLCTCEQREPGDAWYQSPYGCNKTMRVFNAQAFLESAGVAREIATHRRGRNRKLGNHMKNIVVLGIVLIVLGLGALAYQGITYTSRETVIDLGPIHATADREKTLPLPPVLGIVGVAAGVALVFAGRRKLA